MIHAFLENFSRRSLIPFFGIDLTTFTAASNLSSIQSAMFKVRARKGHVMYDKLIHVWLRKKFMKWFLQLNFLQAGDFNFLRLM